MQYTSREVYEFISKQTNDPIVERKTCTISGQLFAIFQSDLDFYAKISPTFNGQKFQIPTPTLCPEERQRRRLSFRNERKLYRRQCDASKKSIISIYSPDKPYKVYDQKIRRSDSRDPMEYEMDFDFEKGFTEQFHTLFLFIPQISLTATNNENAEYVHLSAYNKNCYLVFAGEYNRDCLYSSRIIESENCVDTIEIDKCVQTYECINTEDSNKILYCQGCKSCSSSQFLVDCIGCHECIMCTNLVNKQYCILNKQYTREEYNTQKAILLQQSIDKLLMEYNHIRHQGIHRSTLINNSDGSIGSNIISSKNCTTCFDINDTEDGKYTYASFKTRTMMDVTNTTEQEMGYESVSIGYKSMNCIFTYGGWTCTNIAYCYDCHNSNNLFGCIGLRNKSHCIFNKQYTKEEYEIQVAKIIQHMMTTGEWGEFFHPSLSPFGYNETVAQEYFPLERGKDGKIESKKDLSIPSSLHLPFSEFGYKRSTYNADPSLPAGVQTIKKKNYTDEQRDALLQQDNLETQVFLCSVSGRPYRLQKAEIEFYRKHHLPIPDKHPDIRHEERMKLRPGRTLFLRTCDCCRKEMLSVYDENYKGKVYCEQCYQQEMYS